MIRYSGRLFGAVLLLTGCTLGQNLALSLLNNTPTGYFDVANGVGLAPANITVEAWITYDETGLTPAPTFVWPTIIRKNLAAGGEEYFLRVNAGNNQTRVLRWVVRTPGGVVGLNWTFAAGQLASLTHVAASWDGTTSRLMINGNTVATATGAGALLDNGGAVRVGDGDAATPEFWSGVIDQLRIWSVARSEADVRSTMFNPLPIAPGLEAAWLLDGDVLDYSGNNHHGTLVPPGVFVPVTLPLPTYQTNTAACSLTVDGVSSDAYNPGIVGRCPGQTVTIAVSGTPGPWDAAITLGSQAVPDSSRPLDPWLINIDLTHPSLTFLNGLALSPGNLLPTFSLGAATPPIELDAQFFVLDPSQPLGLALSSVACLRPDLTAFQTTLAGPTADDTPLGPIDVTIAPLNCTPVSFYGTSYNTLFVNPNGRVSFTAGDTDFSATVAEFTADPPSVGVWTDWAPNIHGSVTLGKDCAGRLVVRWSEVPYFGQGTVPPYSSFDIAFDASTQIWSLENLTGLSPSVGATAMLIGICPGNLAPGPGTDPGAQDYTLGLGSVANASDALYQFGTANTLGLPAGLLSGAGPITPVTSINFLPNGLGAYDWFSL